MTRRWPSSDQSELAVVRTTVQYQNKTPTARLSTSFLRTPAFFSFTFSFFAFSLFFRSFFFMVGVARSPRRRLCRCGSVRVADRLHVPSFVSVGSVGCTARRFARWGFAGGIAPAFGLILSSYRRDDTVSWWSLQMRWLWGILFGAGRLLQAEVALSNLKGFVEP